MKKLVLACSALISITCLAAQASPLAGCFQVNPPGAWSELLQGGQPGQNGNEINAGDGATYEFMGAKIAEVKADLSGEWDWLTTYTNGTLVLSNVPAAPWFTPCEAATGFTVVLPEVLVKTRSTRFAATNAGYLEFELSAHTNSYAIRATYAGMPTYTAVGADILAADALASAEIKIGARVRVDIRPDPLNVKSQGVLPVVIMGSAKAKVSRIDPATIKLECVPALRWSYEDVSCDGISDLNLKFDRQAIIQSLPPVKDRDVLSLILTGQLKDGTPIAGSDDVTILIPGKPTKIAPPAPKNLPPAKGRK